MKTFARLPLFGMIALALSGGAIAQSKGDPTYPTKPIRVVVAYSPGGGIDIVTRGVAQKLSETFRQPVTVENRPGANGMVGAQTVARAAADGHNLVVLDRGALTINPSLYKDMTYDPLKDFVYTGVMAELPYVLTINGNLPIKTLQEFISFAKSKPGVLNYATFGAGSLIHLNFEQLNASHGISLVHVPYKGSAAAANAVVSGDVGVFMSSYSAVASFIRDGRLRALAVGRPARLPGVPDVPTMGELGMGNDILRPGYFTFVAPAGTPRTIIARLHTEISRALDTPELEKHLNAAGMEPRTTTPEEFIEGIRREIPAFRKLVQSVGIPMM
jgi:tripartite-type tricarboxylate transporter receptor subunit TctC